MTHLTLPCDDCHLRTLSLESANAVVQKMAAAPLLSSRTLTWPRARPNISPILSMIGQTICSSCTENPCRSVPSKPISPVVFVKLALSRRNPSEAIESLRAATPYELGQTTGSTFGWTALYPVFVRGETYLAAHQGSEAAAEFQKVLDPSWNRHERTH